MGEGVEEGAKVRRAAADWAEDEERGRVLGDERGRCCVLNAA